MNGDWPDPRTDLVKRHAAFELEHVLLNVLAERSNDPTSLIPALIEVVAYNAATVAAHAGLEPIERLLLRFGPAMASAGALPALAKRDVEILTVHLSSEAGRCWPSGARSARALAWALMAAALQRAGDEIGPSGPRIVAGVALSRLRAVATEVAA